MTSSAFAWNTCVRPIPGAPRCLPALRAGFISAGFASAGFASAGFASAGLASADCGSAGSGSSSPSARPSSDGGSPCFRSHGARLLGGRELFSGP
jgi:hypothetical protein